jgi:hypothetical protein
MLALFLSLATPPLERTYAKACIVRGAAEKEDMNYYYYSLAAPFGLCGVSYINHLICQAEKPKKRNSRGRAPGDG